MRTFTGMGWVGAAMLALGGQLVGAAEATPGEILARAAPQEWRILAADDLVVIDLAPEANGAAGGAQRRVVVALLPAPLAGPWVENVRRLARARWWDGLSVYRVQDNYVAQWGDAEGDNPARAKPLPPGLLATGGAAYVVDRAALASAPGSGLDHAPALGADAYAAETRVVAGWPVGLDHDHGWPLHCYGMVGVARDLPPDTGTGSELYAVIGQAPRQLDRNLALVGRVIEGMQWLSSLPRGEGALGFYAAPAARTIIRAVRLGSQVPDLPRYQQLDSAGPTYAAWVAARANRRDPFFVTPAGGVDVCNVPVPVRRVP